MDNCILCYIHPFVLEQEVNVYIEGKCTKIISCTIDKIEDSIVALSKKYNVKNVRLAGSNQLYGLKIKENLMSKYAETSYNIQII